MTGRVQLSLFFIASIIAFSSCWAPVPNTYDGHKKGSPLAPVTIEAFFDFVCPDSNASWPIIKKILTFYGSDNLLFNLHVFPLPYHRNAFVTAQASLVVEKVNKQLFWNYTDLIFNHQAEFFGAPTATLTGNQIVSKLADLVSSNLPVDRNTFLQGMNNDDLNENARVSWKFGALKGVYGTPMFWVNGVPVAADESWTVENWRALLDPLFPNRQLKGREREEKIRLSN